MSIKAKRRTILRIIGAIIILIGFITALLFNYIFFNDFLTYILIICIIFPWFLFSIFLKLELNFFNIHLKIISIILIIYSTGMIILTVVWNLASVINIIFISLALLALLICWHFSLSLYKKQKILFLLSGLFNIIVIILCSSQISILIAVIQILNITIVAAGMLIIIIVEFNLRKNGYMKYIQ